MWLRFACALAATLAVFGVLEYLGVSSLLGRSPDQVEQAAHGRSREFFWALIFVIVMLTALLAAARRWASHAASTFRIGRRP